MIHILVEENYIGNNRLDTILSGISSVVKKKRIAVQVYQDINKIPNGERIVILICSSLKWTTDTIQQLNERGIHPLLFGFQYLDTLYSYSCLTLNYDKSMYLLTSSLLSWNKGDTVLLGYNSDSLPDKLKYMGVRRATELHGVHCRLIKNNGDINACIEEFAKYGKEIKNVVCVNDAIAVLLSSLYPQLLEGRQMCSCSGMRVSEFLKNSYPTCTIDYFKAGVQLAEAYLFLIRSKDIGSAMMTLDMDIVLGGEKEKQKIPFVDLVYSRENVDFYNDGPIKEVECLDRMFINTDEQDISILQDLLAGESYEKIAMNRHFSVNAVKYRVHAMIKNAEAPSKKELLALIEKYGLELSGEHINR